MKVEINKPAPDFSLYNSGKTLVSLNEQRGRNVLLLFFPLAFTRVCTAELCSIRDNLSFYNKANASVFGISVDSLYTLARYKEEQHLNFDLLSDFNKEVSKQYGCLYEEFSYGMKEVSKRSAFIIGKEGLTRYAEILENAGEVPDFERINTILMDLQ